VVHGTAHDEPSKKAGCCGSASSIMEIARLSRIVPLRSTVESCRARSYVRNLRYRLIDDKRDAVAARRVILVGPAASSLPQITRSHL